MHHLARLRMWVLGLKLRTSHLQTLSETPLPLLFYLVPYSVPLASLELTPAQVGLEFLGDPPASPFESFIELGSHVEHICLELCVPESD